MLIGVLQTKLVKTTCIVRLLNHHDLFKCETCTKSYDRKDNLARNQLRYQEETLYQCPHCGKLFSRQDSLNRHKQQHYQQYGGAIKRAVENDENEYPPKKEEIGQ